MPFKQNNILQQLECRRDLKAHLAPIKAITEGMHRNGKECRSSSLLMPFLKKKNIQFSLKISYVYMKRVDRNFKLINKQVFKMCSSVNWPYGNIPIDINHVTKRLPHSKWIPDKWFKGRVEFWLPLRWHSPSWSEGGPSMGVILSCSSGRMRLLAQILLDQAAEKGELMCVCFPPLTLSGTTLTEMPKDVPP